MILFKDNKFDIDSDYLLINDNFSLTDLNALDTNNFIENTHEVTDEEQLTTKVNE